MNSIVNHIHTHTQTWRQRKICGDASANFGGAEQRENSSTSNKSHPNPIKKRQIDPDYLFWGTQIQKWGGIVAGFPLAPGLHSRLFTVIHMLTLFYCHI